MDDNGLADTEVIASVGNVSLGHFRNRKPGGDTVVELDNSTMLLEVDNGTDRLGADGDIVTGDEGSFGVDEGLLEGKDDLAAVEVDGEDLETSVI